MAPGGRHPIEDDASALVTTARAHLGEHWAGAFSRDLLDDYAQHAYADLLEKYRDGEDVKHPKALIKKIAYRRARDENAKLRPEFVDPERLAQIGLEDNTGDPAERVLLRSDLANATVVVDQLPDEQQAVYRARFVEDLTCREIATKIGGSKSQVHRLLGEIRERFEGVFSADGDDGTKLRILSAYAFGDKSARKAAELLLKHDPTAGPIYRQLRGFHEGAAALVPPATLDAAGEPSLVERIGSGLSELRDRLSGWGGTEPSTGTESAAQVLGSGAGRGTGAAAGGVLAKFGVGGAIGAKGIAACVGGSAATVACVAAGVVPGIGPRDDADKPEHRPAVVEKTAPKKLVDVLPVVPEDPAAAENPAPAPDAATADAAQTPVPDPAPVTEPAPEPEPAPVPVSAQEFGPAPSAPASTPTESSSSSSPTTSRSATAVQQEFGP